jgi:FixJ family two-component response regulator
VTKDSQALVIVVDDDEAVRSSTRLLLKSVGLPAVTYSSAQEFLDNYDPQQPGCVVLDVRMPGMSGLELQEKLAERDFGLPILFLTGHGDVPMAVRAMKQGAFDFLTKPVDGDVLVAAVRAAIARDQLTRAEQDWLDELRARLATLTPRERQVFEHVISGQLNKQIAADLGTVEKTVKVHRGRVMEKLKARSLAELVRLAGRLGISPAARGR